MGAVQQVILPIKQFSAGAADFDATNDWMTRGAGLTGAADSATGILSVWLRLDGSDGVVQQLLTNTGNRVQIAKKITSNALQVFLKDSGGNTKISLTSVTGYTSGATWLHWLSSWNTASAGAESLYVNDVSDLAGSPTIIAGNIDYTVANWSVGGEVGGTNKFDGCIGDLYFAPGQYLDFSSAANRRKFISANGKPVNLGTDGSRPTGTAPIIYHHLDYGAAAAGFATNYGSGGNFSITGSLDIASSSPST